MTIEGPGINVQKKTNEENIQVLKGYLSDMADILNHYIAIIDSLTEKVNELESKIASLESEGR